MTFPNARIWKDIEENTELYFPNSSNSVNGVYMLKKKKLLSIFYFSVSENGTAYIFLKLSSILEWNNLFYGSLALWININIEDNAFPLTANA